MSTGMKLFWTLMKNVKLPRRNFGQGQHGYGNRKSMVFTLRELAFEWSGYNKYGFYSHDIIDYDHPVVREALRRLPKDVLDARNFRIIRAVQLNFLGIHLPREKWITYEQDLEYRYLDPYIEEIKAEQAEIHEFGCLNYSDEDWPADEAYQRKREDPNAALEVSGHCNRKLLVPLYEKSNPLKNLGWPGRWAMTQEYPQDKFGPFYMSGKGCVELSSGESWQNHQRLHR